MARNQGYGNPFDMWKNPTPAKQRVEHCERHAHPELSLRNRS